MALEKARFLVHATGPLEDLFAAPLKQLGSITPYKGSLAPQEFDLLVLDPRSLTGEEFAASAGFASRMLKANKPVLVLRPSPAHKRALAAAGALRTYGESESVALLIEPRPTTSARLQLALAEQFGPQAGPARLIRSSAHGIGRGPTDLGAVDNLPVQQRKDPTITDMGRFIERVTAAVASRRGGKPSPAAASTEADASPNAPPTNIPVGLYDITPINIYYPIVPGGAPESGYTPPAGSVYLEGLVTIGVYYDNLSYNTPVQWLLIEHSGLFYTAGLEANDSTHIGWSISMLQIQGQTISSSTIVTRQSSPNNVNNQSQYTSSSSFTVGVAGGTDGLNGNASYTIGSSQTSSIADWTVVQQSPNSWNFYQQTPYNGTTPSGQFANGCAGSDGVASLPPISTGSLAYNTQTVYIQQPASQQNSSIQYTYNTYSSFTYANETGTDWHAWYWAFGYDPSQSYVIDWSAAWPSTT